MFSGICRDGPLSGKPLHHSEQRLFLVKRRGKLISHYIPRDWTLSTIETSDGEAEVGAYDFDGDLWQWTREL